MDRDWRDFKALYGSLEGARAAFEDACEELFREIHKDSTVQRVKVRQGDGGIDIYVGEIGISPIIVIQCKFFLDKFGSSQQSQIRDSFKTAVNSQEFELEKWILCVPLVLDIDQNIWWASWKKKQLDELHKTEGFISLKNGNEIISLLKEYGIYNRLFKITDLLLLEKIDKNVQALHESKDNIVPSYDLFSTHRNLTEQIHINEHELEQVTNKKSRIEQQIQRTDDEDIRDTLDEHVQNLSIKQLDLSNQINQKKQELTLFEENVKRLAETLNKSEHVDSSRLKQARTLFEQGDLEGANAILDPKDLQKDREEIERDSKSLAQKREVLAQEYITKAQLVQTDKTNKHWFNDAYSYFETAVEIDGNQDTFFSFAYFLQEHNCHEHAVSFYAKALDIYRALAEVNPQTYMPDVAMTLNNLANVNSILNQFDAAQNQYYGALEIYRALTESNPQTFMSDVAMTLNNLANVNSILNQFDTAQNQYEEALKIYRALVIDNPQKLMSDVAMTLNNLASLNQKYNQIHTAQKQYEEALEIYRVLTESNPQTFMPDMAMTLNNLANLNKKRNQLHTAQKPYEEALEIYRALTESNPQTFMPNLAMTLNNLASLNSILNQFDTAQNQYKEALAIYRTLTEVNPKKFMPDLAMTLNNLANFNRSLEQFDTAQNQYEKALEIYRALTEVNPQIFRPNVATTLNNLANLHSALNQFETAEKEFEQALDIYRALAEDNPQIFRPDVAMTLNNLANVNRKLNQLDSAQKQFNEALTIRRVLTEVNPDVFQTSLAETLINIAILHLYSSPDKSKSLSFSHESYINALPYSTKVPIAEEYCQTAIAIWQEWGEDLIKYIQDKQRDTQ
ncbi:tetratricopeptide repeat protein [Runella zeae]|uniref:tetratricopeptide repeat protein n=1 Tax=Runella zeae TaxID=94255 RepID=UPI0003FC99D5|nr:tetratricopeptide repeat protein [Runella zeae]